MIVAHRSLTLRQAPTDVDVSVRIFSPENSDDQWRCEYEIDWPEGTRKAQAAGVDSAQALFSALAKVGAEIYTSDYHKSGKLSWNEADGGYGFPVPQSLRDLLVGDDAKFL
jgi:hypothetical protein